jgi:hypothetical protein
MTPAWTSTTPTSTPGPTDPERVLGHPGQLDTQLIVSDCQDADQPLLIAACGPRPSLTGTPWPTPTTGGTVDLTVFPAPITPG